MGGTHHDDVIKALGYGQLPDGYFRDKTARDYRFLIFEDVVKAGMRESCSLSSARAEEKLASAYAATSEVALYCHVPWCVEECTYCYYWGKIDKKEEMARLLKAERDHVLLYRRRFGLGEKTVTSIYYGGGTPTVLPKSLLEEQLAFFVEGFKLAPDAEVCTEASIGTLTRERVEVLERYATRLSIGIQSFSDAILQRVARTFSRERAIDTLRDIVPRFKSVNIDLIYGMQFQSMKDWLETIEQAIALDVPSITLYRLEVREDPPLVKTFVEKPESFPDELTCRVMRHEAKKLLDAAGYRENLVGWFLKERVADTRVYRERWQKQTPCVAFGPHVQNYGRDHFYVNHADKENYIASVNAGELPIESFHELSPRQQLLIWVMAQWKSNREIDMTYARERFGAELSLDLLHLVIPYVEMGLLTSRDGAIGLTYAGRSLLEWTLRDLVRASFPAAHTPVHHKDQRVSLAVV